MNSKRAIVIFAVLSLMFASLTSAIAAETFTLKCQSMFPAGQPNYKNFEKFCENVKKMSGGRLIIKPLPADSIVPTFEMLEAVQNSVFDGMHTVAAYSSGKEPGLSFVTDLIYGWDEPWQAEAWFYNGGGQELLNEFYHRYNVHAIGVVQWGFESLPTKFPVKSMADFKGKKIRSPQGMQAELFKKLGVGVVVLPGAEVYSALDKGVIDGADWGTPSMNIAMGLDQVCKYFIYPEFRSGALSDFSLRLDIWEKLPEDLKLIVQIAVRAWNSENLRELALLDLKAVKTWEANGGKAISWSPEEMKKISKIARDEIWPEWAKKSPYAQKVLDSLLEWQNKNGITGQN